MSFSKRYTIFNFYVRGSNQMPQGFHAINNFWKKVIKNEFSQEAISLWHDWAFNSEVEVSLQGPGHQEMEDLFSALSKIRHIPSTKFNESESAANGLCTVVSFVADERMISAINHLRFNRISPANAVYELQSKMVIHVDPTQNQFKLTEDEIFIVSKVAFLPLTTGI